MRKKRWKRFTGLGIAAALLISTIGAAPVHADAVKVVTLGADLSEEQKQSILQFFGVDESQVYIITITNQDEHDKLGLLIPSEQIGTRTFSCAMVNPTTSGGVQVKTANMNYVTSNMIASTLSTSGVVNCDVLTAAPFEVSGTGALTGTMMAYETASGETLSEEKKQLANEELVTTGELADTVGQEEATLMVNDIKIHVIRDELKEETEVQNAVDTVVDTCQSAMEVRAAAGGEAVAGTVSQEQKEKLYDFGYKVGQMNYNYDDMKVTLQRVTQNIVEETEIEDPITETFEDLSEESQLSDDSILRETDDSALGEDSNVNSTDVSTVEHETAEPVSTSSITIGAGTYPENASTLGIDRLYGEQNGAAALLDMQGNALTEYRFDPDSISVEESKHYIVAQDLSTGAYGMLTRDGAELIPFQYTLCSTGTAEFNIDIGEYEYANQYWQAGYMLEESSEEDYDLMSHRGYYKIVSVDLYHIQDGAAVLAAAFTRDQFLGWRAHGDYVNIGDRSTGIYTLYNSSMEAVASNLSDLRDYGNVADAADSSMGYEIQKVNGQAILVDSEGNTVLEPGYKDIDRLGADGIVVSDGTHYGFIDYEGNVILPCIFSRICKNYNAEINLTTDADTYSANGYYQVIDENNNIAFAVKGGGISFNTGIQYNSEGIEQNGASVLYEDADGGFHIYAADGMVTDLPQEYYYCNAFGDTSGMLYLCRDENFRTGTVIDWHGEVIWTGIDSVKAAEGYLTITTNAQTGTYALTYPDPVEMEAVSDGNTGVAELTELEDETAASGVSLKKTTEIENADYIYNSNNLLIRSSDAYEYALADLSGELLSDYEYDYGDFSGYSGLLRLSTQDGYVLMNQSGEILTDAYDYFEIENEHWVIAFTLEDAENEEEADFTNYSDGYWDIVTADVYHISEDAASLVNSFNRDQFGGYEPIDEDCFTVYDRTQNLWNVYDKDMNVYGEGYSDHYDAKEAVQPSAFSDNGHQGVQDKDGNILVPAAYKYVYTIAWDEGYAVVSDGEKYGLVDFEGHLILPVSFDRISKAGYNYLYNNSGYYNVELDGEYAIVRQGGEVTVSTYQEAQLDGVSMMTEDGNGTFTIYAGDGNTTELTDLNDLNCLRNSNGFLYYELNENNRYALYDWHGTLLLEDYIYCYISYDGSTLIAENADHVTEIYEISYE